MRSWTSTQKVFKATARLFLVAGLIVSTSGAFAGEKRESVQETMKNMGAQFKVLVLALVRNQETPADTLKTAAGTLAKLVIEAKAKAPSHLLDPATGEVKAGEESTIRDYEDLMGKLSIETNALVEALATDDRATASSILKQRIIPIQREGHERFKL